MASEKRLIDANALLNDNEMYFCKPCKAKGHDYHEVACRACWVDDMRIAIEDAPTVDVEEAVHGRWIRYEHGSGIYCSECKRKRRYKDAHDNYCPNCGADMRERKDNG